VAVANFYNNNNNKYSKFSRVRFSIVSRMFGRLRRLILTITLATISLLDQCCCPYRVSGVSNASKLKIDIIEAREVEYRP
jgi:hypothetical protein